MIFVPRIPENDEVVEAAESFRGFGGRGTVPACVLAALGFVPTLWTVVGRRIQSEFLSFSDSHGIKTDDILWVDGDPPIATYTAFIDKSTARTFATVERPQLQQLDLSTLTPPLENALALYVSTNDERCNIAVLKGADPNSQIIMHGLGYRFVSDRYLNLVATRCQFVVGNRLEAKRFESDCGRSVQSLLNGKCEWIVITAGSDPVTLYSRSRTSEVAIAASDPEGSAVGAGDTLAAGLLAGLLSGLGVEDSVQLGAQLAAVALRENGAIPRQTELAEVFAKYLA